MDAKLHVDNGAEAQSHDSESSMGSRDSFHFDIDNEDVFAQDADAPHHATPPHANKSQPRNTGRAAGDTPITAATPQSNASATLSAVNAKASAICRMEMPAAITHDEQEPPMPQHEFATDMNSSGGDDQSGSDSDRSQRRKPSGLAAKNYHVLTPDKRVMLSLPPDCIVPTVGSEKYLQRNKNKLIFSFCLCYVYSLGSTCHHGSSCDFIHCMPDKLPQVVNMAPLNNEDLKRANGELPDGADHAEDTAVLPAASGDPSQAAVRSFPVHWSTPIANLESATYARLPAGRQLYVKDTDDSRGDSHNHRSTRVIPSEMLYETVGSLKAMNQPNGNVPLRFCKHYRREKCARGPLCHFVHPVVLADANTSSKVVYDLGSVPQGSSLLSSLSPPTSSPTASHVVPVGRDDGSEAHTSFIGSRSGSDYSLPYPGNPVSIQHIQAPPMLLQQQQPQQQACMAPQSYVQCQPQYIPAHRTDYGSSSTESHSGSGYAQFPQQGISFVSASRGSSPTQGYVPVLVPMGSAPRSPTFAGPYVAASTQGGQGVMLLQSAPRFNTYSQSGNAVPIIAEMPPAVALSGSAQPWDASMRQQTVSQQMVAQPMMATGLYHTVSVVHSDASSRGGSPYPQFPAQFNSPR